MANLQNNKGREHQRERMAQEGTRQERARERAIEKKKREALLRLFIICGIVVLALMLLILFMSKRTYHNYKVIRTSEKEDIVSTKYEEMQGKILKYSPNEAALLTKKLQPVWKTTYKMDNPVVDVRDGYAVIADVDGTTMKIFDKNGNIGSITTSYAIVKARISSNGLVAAILNGGDDTWINFYASDGSLIAENQTKIDDPGFPLDIAISDNGVIMMVAYQFIDAGNTTSYVAFYNFGAVGQNEDDKIVSGYTYEGVIVPQIEYMAGNRYAAVRDDGFTLYSGKEIPKEVITNKMDKEIVSTFFDDDLIGLVFRNEDGDSLYTMEVYTTAGKLKFTRNFNISYTSIKISQGNIIMYNSSEISVINSKGTERYNGTVNGTIKNLFKLGYNKYLLVLDNSVSVIKFS